MDIFILDALLRPIDVVDEFESIVWVERFAVKGDFELIVPATPANRKRFVNDIMLSIPDSKRLMQVDTVEDAYDVEQGSTLKIKGPEIISITDKRAVIAMNTLTGQPHPSYDVHGTSPMGLLEFFFFSICVWGDLDPQDIIPFVQEQGEGLYPPGTIPESSETNLTWSQEPASLYSVLVKIAEAYDLGFRLYKDPDASKLYFEAYTGSDRTTNQIVLPPVIFSEDMVNLQNTSELSDSSQHFNVIRVIYYHKNLAEEDVTTSVVVSDPELAFSSGGFERKVKILNVSSVPESTPNIPVYLEQLGKEELAKSRTVNIFDGEIDQNSDFVYEEDYFLGDLVEVRGKNGSSAYMRVVEQIIKEDGTGKSSYPSLITKDYINPGTWRSWKYDVEWSAMGSGEYWANQ